MALGQITLQPVDTQGQKVLHVAGLVYTNANVVGDGAYGAGGSSITPQQLGFQRRVLSTDVKIVTPIAGVIAADAVIQTDGSVKLKTYSGTGTTPNIGLVEATGTANQSGLTVQIQAFGI